MEIDSIQHNLLDLEKGAKRNYNLALALCVVAAALAYFSFFYDEAAPSWMKIAALAVGYVAAVIVAGTSKAFDNFLKAVEEGKTADKRKAWENAARANASLAEHSSNNAKRVTLIAIGVAVLSGIVGFLGGQLFPALGVFVSIAKLVGAVALFSIAWWNRSNSNHASLEKAINPLARATTFEI